MEELPADSVIAHGRSLALLRRRSIYLLPNLFTTAALFFGFYAIVQAMSARFELAAIAIFVLLEKTIPFGDVSGRFAGGAMILVGTLILAL